MKRLFIMWFTLVLVGCDNSEFVDKHEYSLVESYAYQLGERDNSGGIRFITHSDEGGSYDLIAIPLCVETSGFSVMIPLSRSAQNPLKRFPITDVRISQGDIRQIEARVALSEEVRAFLNAQVNSCED